MRNLTEISDLVDSALTMVVATVTPVMQYLRNAYEKKEEKPYEPPRRRPRVNIVHRGMRDKQHRYYNNFIE
jgi:hypothetical protein